MIKVVSICTTLLTKIKAPYNKNKRDSHWIYSSLSQQMNHSLLPTITICTLPKTNHFDFTLRIKKCLERAHILLSYNPQSTASLLKNNNAKNYQNNQKQENTLILKKGQNDLIINENKQIETKWSLELSKQLQMAIENEKIVKSNNDRENRQIKQQQQELLNYMEISHFKQHLQSFKNKEGYAKVGSLLDNIDNIAVWRKANISIVCVLDELSPNHSKQLFNYLQQKRLPYQILPGHSCLINMLASSGFPADRFAIQYLPISFTHIFILRKPMKMTIAMTIQANQIDQCLISLINIYGYKHMIYIEDENSKMMFRGEVDQCKLNDHKKIGIWRVAIAPYLSNFNEELKQQKNKITQLYGQAMHQNTHAVRMEFIGEQLQKLQRKNQTKEIIVQNFIKELIPRVSDNNILINLVCDTLGIQNKQCLALLQKVKNSTMEDHIGIANFIKRN